MKQKDKVSEKNWRVKIRNFIQMKSVVNSVGIRRLSHYKASFDIERHLK